MVRPEQTGIAYIDAGYEVAGMLGQWEHNYPDQWTKHNNQASGYGGEAIHNMTRWDWGQICLNGWNIIESVGPKPTLHAQIQRNDGEWRIEETWPPLDTERVSHDMSMCESTAFLGTAGLALGGENTVTVTCPPMSNEADTHISGLATFHLSVVPSFDGGQVFIEMQDSETGTRLGHATMDVRYHAGGYEAQNRNTGSEYYYADGIPRYGCVTTGQPRHHLRACRVWRRLLASCLHALMFYACYSERLNRRDASNLSGWQ